MSEDRVVPCNNSQEMFKEINTMILQKFQLQMKVIKDTGILTENEQDGIERVLWSLALDRDRFCCAVKDATSNTEEKQLEY